MLLVESGPILEGLCPDLKGISSEPVISTNLAGAALILPGIGWAPNHEAPVDNESPRKVAHGM